MAAAADQTPLLGADGVIRFASVQALREAIPKLRLGTLTARGKPPPPETTSFKLLVDGVWEATAQARIITSVAGRILLRLPDVSEELLKQISALPGAEIPALPAASRPAATEEGPRPEASEEPPAALVPSEPPVAAKAPEPQPAPPPQSSLTSPVAEVGSPGRDVDPTPPAPAVAAVAVDLAPTPTTSPDAPPPPAVSELPPLAAAPPPTEPEPPAPVRAPLISSPILEVMPVGRDFTPSRMAVPVAAAVDAGLVLTPVEAPAPISSADAGLVLTPVEEPPASLQAAAPAEAPPDVVPPPPAPVAEEHVPSPEAERVAAAPSSIPQAAPTDAAKAPRVEVVPPLEPESPVAATPVTSSEEAEPEDMPLVDGREIRFRSDAGFVRRHQDLIREAGVMGRWVGAGAPAWECQAFAVRVEGHAHEVSLMAELVPLQGDKVAVVFKDVAGLRKGLEGLARQVSGEAHVEPEPAPAAPAETTPELPQPAIDAKGRITFPDPAALQAHARGIVDTAGLMGQWVALRPAQREARDFVLCVAGHDAEITLRGEVVLQHLHSVAVVFHDATAVRREVGALLGRLGVTDPALAPPEPEPVVTAAPEPPPPPPPPPP
ncbi:MAG: hypothetical protein AB2A00_28820, partial [Myxococcota bacterium]